MLDQWIPVKFPAEWMEFYACCAEFQMLLVFLRYFCLTFNKAVLSRPYRGKELFQSKQPDYDNLLELRQKGLTDQLTGLSTRAVLFNKTSTFLGGKNAYGTLLFIDLDDLKRINDNFGHAARDHMHCSTLQRL